MLAPLTAASFAQALAELVASDADLAQIFQVWGPPPFWVRDPGFPTLIHIILEQQVSLASAQAAFDRLQTAIAPLTPDRLLQLTDIELKQIGFSRQKTLYSRSLAQSLLAGQLDLARLEHLSDDEVRAQLKQIKGIGDWTVDIYLLMALCRPDALPKGDLGLIVAVQQVKQLANRPTPAEVEAIAAPWRPWRAVATRLLWHQYLSDRAKPQLKRRSQH